jgi:hypothetical protein
LLPFPIPVVVLGVVPTPPTGLPIELAPVVPPLIWPTPTAAPWAFAGLTDKTIAATTSAVSILIVVHLSLVKAIRDRAVVRSYWSRSAGFRPLEVVCRRCFTPQAATPAPDE